LNLVDTGNNSAGVTTEAEHNVSGLMRFDISKPMLTLTEYSSRPKKSQYQSSRRLSKVVSRGDSRRLRRQR
jgi:hypothetical protein